MAKNLFFKIFITLPLLLILTGCSIRNPFVNVGQVLQESDSGTKNELVVWGMFEDKDVLKALFDEFESQNSDVEITYVEKDLDTYYNDLKTVLLDGQPNSTPDVFLVYNSWTRAFESYTTVAPSSAFTLSQMQSELHDFVSYDFAYDDSVHGIPLWVDALGLVYNESMLINTGDTVISSGWESFVTQANNMTFSNSTGEVQYGFSGGRTGNVEFGAEAFTLIMLQARNQPITPTARDNIYDSNEFNQVNDGLLFYKSLSGNSAPWNSTAKLDTAEFIEQRLASFIAPSWRLNDILKFKNEYNLDFTLQTTEVPQLNLSADDRVNLASYWGFVVSKDSKYNSDAWDLLAYFAEKGTQEKYLDEVQPRRSVLPISSRKDVVTTQTADALLKPYIDSLGYTTSFNQINGQKFEAGLRGVVDGTIDLETLKTNYETLKENPDEL